MSLDCSFPSKEGKEQKTTCYAGGAINGYTNIFNQMYLQAFSSALYPQRDRVRRYRVYEADEVFYSDSSVEHYDKVFHLKT